VYKKSLLLHGLKIVIFVAKKQNSEYS